MVSRSNLTQALAASARPARNTAAMDDKAIRAQLLRELQQQSWWRRGTSFVTVEDGVVTYAGTVDAEEERDAARVAAENVPGVRGIEDKRIVFRTCHRWYDVDPVAFEQLMRRHNRMLFRVARAILHDDAAAEDTLQEAWLRAYRAIDIFRGESRLSTWLVRIVVNEALARRRKDQRGLAADEDTERAAHPQDEPESLAQRTELRHRLEAKIGGLPEVGVSGGERRLQVGMVHRSGFPWLWVTPIG